MAVRVLIADSSALVRDIIRQHLECAGCEVVAEAETAEQAADLFHTVAPDLVTLGTGLGGGDDGVLDLFRRIRRAAPCTSVIMVDPARAGENPQVFVSEGALDCVVAPFDPPSFGAMWRRLAETYPELKRASSEPASAR
jgi:two-component system chemotaxis response regulator CheY